jgi:hypothetical protein
MFVANANVENIDTDVRISVGVALIVPALTHVIGAWGWSGVVPLATGAFRFCPAYRPLGFNTCKRNSRQCCKNQ